MTTRVRRRLRFALLVVIAGLYGVSIPWYRAGGADADLWWGLPSWVSVAIGCYVLAACANALAWWLTEVPDRPEAATDPGRP